MSASESTCPRPNPWLALLGVSIAAVAGGFLGARLSQQLSPWLNPHDLIREGGGVIVSGVYFFLFTRKYRQTQITFRPRDWLTVFLIISPWLFAGVNLWGKVISTSLFTATLLAAVVNALFIGVSEELLFRGILFRAFQGKSSAYYVLITSLLFGLLHLPLGYQIALIASLIGVGYGLARLSGTPLSLLILCHALTDLPGLLPHTFRAHYQPAALAVIALAMVIAIAFFLRKTSWRNKSHPSPPTLSPNNQLALRS